MDRVFNNADSFAMAFDESWKQQSKSQNFIGLSTEDRKHYLFENCIQDHPFLINSPKEANQVADFRIRLLGLDQQ
jgi:hypothetical protein